MSATVLQMPRKQPPRVAMEFCHDEPWLLDSEPKVRWANCIMSMIGHADFKWKLGDHTWYRPA